MTQANPGSSLMPASQSSGSVIPSFQLGGTIDPSVLTNIVIGRRQEKLHEQRVDLQRQRADLTNALGQVQATLAPLIDEVQNAVDLTNERTVAYTLNQAGYATFEAKVTACNPDVEKGLFQITIGVYRKAAEKYGTSIDIERELTVPFTDDYKAVLTRIDGIQKDIAAIDQQLLEIKREVTNIPMLKVRADRMIAEKILSQTAEGRDFLQTLDNIQAPTAV